MVLCVEITELELKNPITSFEVDKLIDKIRAVSAHAYLLINIGEHNFQSIDIIKYLKAELHKIEPILSQFIRIAIVTVPPFINESSDIEKLQYFYSISKARDWLRNGF